MADSPPVLPASQPAPPSRKWWLLGALGLLLLLAMLALFDPARHGFYPRCYFKAVTGLDCPGCGGLRAVHQLLRGNVRAAFALNPLLFVLAPALAWFGLAECLRLRSGRALPHPFRHPAWLWILLVVVVGFVILRNLPAGLFIAHAP